MAGINELKQKIESDVAFREALEKAADGNELLSKIKESGFEVTTEELLNAFQSNEKGELNDEKLENVTGGEVESTDLRVSFEIEFSSEDRWPGILQRIRQELLNRGVPFDVAKSLPYGLPLPLNGPIGMRVEWESPQAAPDVIITHC